MTDWRKIRHICGPITVFIRVIMSKFDRIKRFNFLFKLFYLMHFQMHYQMAFNVNEMNFRLIWPKFDHILRKVIFGELQALIYFKNVVKNSNLEWRIAKYETQDSAFLSLPKFSRLASIEAMACAVLHISPNWLIKGWIPKTLILTYLIMGTRSPMRGLYANQGPWSNISNSSLKFNSCAPR